MVLQIQSSASDVNSPSPYHLYGRNIHRVNECRDLGIQVTHNLNFHSHISKSCGRANGLLAVIRANFPGISPALLSHLYGCYVRPVLEFGSQIWNPHSVCDNEMLNRVQARASRIPYSLRTLPRESRLSALGWPSLALRRTYLDLICLFKLLFSPTQTYFIPAPLTHNTRGHSRKLFLKPSKKDSLKYSFFRRIIPIWNNLPEEVVAVRTVGLFKGRLRLHLGI